MKPKNMFRGFDTLIVGAGLAGLSAAVYLSDQGKRVLLLEKEDHLGGLASSGTTRSGIRYDRGAAYWTNAYEEEKQILDHIGLGDYEKRYPISEPADSLLVPDESGKNKLHMGIWEDSDSCEKIQAPYKNSALEGKYECGVDSLPADFAVFKFELEMADKDHLIGDQPIEETQLDLDSYSARDWIHSMPARLALRTDNESKALYARFLRDPRVKRIDPMKNVIGLLDLYCRSALGTTSENVSALAFANFYISEITTRYTTATGTNGATLEMEKILRARNKKVRIITSSLVTELKNTSKGVSVTFQHQGKLYKAHGKYAVYAGQVKFATKLIPGLKEKSEAQADIMDHLGYAHYSVHNVLLKGHPYRATYDTWTLPLDETNQDFTDVILGRWMDPTIQAYEGMRGFNGNEPKDDQGIMTIYHPLPENYIGGGYSEQTASNLAEQAVDRMIKLLTPVLKEGNEFNVQSVETTRWPFSVHVAKPGHFSQEARILRKPFGRIYFANNNLGTPAFEEALFRGHCAANNILVHAKPGFSQETWSRCPIE